MRSVGGDARACLVTMNLLYCILDGAMLTIVCLPNAWGHTVRTTWTRTSQGTGIGESLVPYRTIALAPLSVAFAARVVQLTVWREQYLRCIASSLSPVRWLQYCAETPLVAAVVGTHVSVRSVSCLCALAVLQSVLAAALVLASFAHHPWEARHGAVQHRLLRAVALLPAAVPCGVMVIAVAVAAANETVRAHRRLAAVFCAVACSTVLTQKFAERGAAGKAAHAYMYIEIVQSSLLLLLELAVGVTVSGNLVRSTSLLPDCLLS